MFLIQAKECRKPERQAGPRRQPERTGADGTGQREPTVGVIGTGFKEKARS